jgi:hypothetical protein
MVGRNYQRVPFLGIKTEPVLLEHTDEAVEVNRTDGGH